MYTDFVQFKSASPVGFNSKEYFEELSNITVLHLSREDHNEYLDLGTYDMSGIVLMRSPEQGGREKVVIKLSEHMSATVRWFFAENPECLKITLVRRGKSFYDDSAKTTAQTLRRDLQSRGVTVENSESFILPTPFVEIFTSGYSQVIMAALKMDNFVFPADAQYLDIFPAAYKSNFFDFGVKEKNMFSVSENEKSPRLSDSSSITFDKTTIGNVPSKTVKKNKNRARESFSHIQIKDLITAGLIHPNRDIRFKIHGLDDKTPLPPISLLATGSIKVGNKITNVLSQAGQMIYDSAGKNIVCKSAWAQFEVKTPAAEWKTLKDIRKTYSDMLKIKGAANATLAKQNVRNVSLQDIVEAKILPTYNIHTTVRGIYAEGTITSEGNIIVNNVTYSSPAGALNGALKTLKGNNEPQYKDGWASWLVKNNNGDVKPLKYYKDMLK